MKPVAMVALAFVTTLSLFAAGCSGSDSGGGSTGSSKSAEGAGSGGRSTGGGGESEEGTSPTTPTNPTNPTSPTTKKKPNGAQCTKSADCESDFCVFKSGGSLGMCTKTCSDDIDCDLGEQCVKLGDAPQKACVPE